MFTLNARVAIVTAALALTALSSQAAAQTAKPICGIEYESPLRTQEIVELVKGLAPNTSDPMFVSYFDPADGTAWTFSTPANPSYPAVICRRMIQKDGAHQIAMDIRCAATRPICDQSFVELNKKTIENLVPAPPAQ
jgi:hypothetical protein